MTTEQILQNIITEAAATFEGYKKLAEDAFKQISDEEFFRVSDDESNSIAVITKHVAGNLRSRWTDFLTTDGEKSDRDRDAEFVAEADTRDILMTQWETGWERVLTTFAFLKPEDLGKIVRIRGEEMTAAKAINRSLTHTSYHVGQIVYAAKSLRAAQWENLSVPKNQSREFTERMKPETDRR